MRTGTLKTISGAFVALLSCVLLTLPAMARDNAYVNGIDISYPPFAYVDENGQPAGFDVDSMDWIAKRMGFTVTHLAMDWDGIIPALVARKVDMICSGMSITPERAKRVTFTAPYWVVSKVLVIDKNSPLTLEDVTHGAKRLGVQRGTNEAEILQMALEKKEANYTLRFYDTSSLGIDDLQKGNIDAFGLDNAPAHNAIDNGKSIKILTSFGVEDKFAVGTRHEDKDLREIINEGYKLLMADPYWAEIQQKYLR